MLQNMKMPEEFGKLGDVMKPVLKELNKARKTDLPKFDKKAKTIEKRNRAALEKMSDAQARAVMDKACEETVKATMFSKNMEEMANKFSSMDDNKNLKVNIKNVTSSMDAGSLMVLNRLTVSTGKFARAWEKPEKMPWCNFLKGKADAQSKNVIKEVEKEIGAFGVAMKDVQSKGLLGAMMDADPDLSREDKAEIKQDMAEMKRCVELMEHHEKMPASCKEYEELLSDFEKQGISREMALGLFKAIL